MSISRLVVIPLLAAVFILPATAQTSPASNSTTLLPQVNLPSDSSRRIHVDQFRLPAKLPLGPATREDTLSELSRNELQLSQGATSRSFINPDIPQVDSADTCYYIRDYRMKRDDRHTDVTRPDGYSTCQPATRYGVKSAVDSQPSLRR
jgi:hypothetical protein